MFGYLRPQNTELRVKEDELYRAVYCGLCRTMRKKISFFASLTLNYDFVFLALLRAEITAETFHFCQHRCPVHPLKKRNCAKLDSDALYFTALVHLALSYEKLKDDRRDRDHSFFKRVLVRLYLPLISFSVRKQKRKSPLFCEILEAISASCDELAALELEGVCDIDRLAHCCARGLEESCSLGLSEKEGRLMRAAGAAAGRLIYLLDACDDLADDAKEGSFNPFLRAYGSLAAAREKLQEIDLVLALYAKDLAATVELIAAPMRYGPICTNITQLGIPGAIRRVIGNHQKQIERTLS